MLVTKTRQPLATNDIEAIDVAQLVISELTHPEYRTLYEDWEKWRRTYESGDEYIEYYLKKFSTRENEADFSTRKEVTYVPAFAKAAVNDVKDAIFQRIADVARGGGPQTYQDGVKGLKGGVDLAGTTMNSFIGTTILPELLMMSRVGVFVDMPELPGETLSDQQGTRPYIYHYPIEAILNWDIDVKNNKTYKKLLLRDDIYKICDITGLPNGVLKRYRYMWVQDNVVLVQFFNENSKPIDRFGNDGIDVIELDIPIIPFVLFEISDSLLSDVANYQIALLNLASSDILYSLKSNFPFYIEPFDPRADNLFRRPVGHETPQADETSVQIVQGGERADAIVAKNYEVEVGATTGRRIPKGLDYPTFIHPSSEPLKASMAKQDELKKDIRMLVKLAVSSLSPKMASAESKDFDERGLEAGLSAIGLELEQGERLIAQYWQMYGTTKSTVTPTVKYPQKYSLQSDRDRRQEAKDILDVAKEVPSVIFKRESVKQAAIITLGAKVTHEKLKEIEEEIDDVDVVVNPEELHRDIELGLIDLEAKNLYFASTLPFVLP
ncbi:hypothetical protein LCGC14_1307130 [marine sediment metagenome]|uniref:Uncharacterized protein n=1 Tax=marine sediment metagenome TaxID=412755 RepID=A0A0F9KND9_9ZZZZ